MKRILERLLVAAVLLTYVIGILIGCAWIARLP
jgi:hypothetical protein